MKTVSKINEELHKEATELGACDKAMSAWNGNLSKASLIDLWLHHFDFAIKCDFPAIDVIKNDFGKALRHEKGVYVDENILERNKNGIVAVNGCCKGTLMYDMYSTARVYVRHDSDVSISCKDMAKIFIHVYDNAKVDVSAEDMARVFVYKHGDRCEVNTEGEVTVRDKISY